MSSCTIRPAWRAGRTALEVSIIRTTRATTLKTKQRQQQQQQQSRTFSATRSQRVGEMITFNRGSSLPLSQVFEQAQHDLIIPSYLSAEDRKKVFRGRWKDKLANNPIEIDVNGTTVRYRHLDRAGGKVPAGRTLLHKATALMKTNADWSQLPKLLEGLSRHARCPLDDADWLKTIRRASLANQLGRIFTIAANPRRYGLILDTPEKTQQLLTEIVWGAAEVPGKTNRAPFQVVETERALRSAENVFDWLALPEHQLSPGKKAAWTAAGRFPLRRDPQLLGTPLFLTAVLVARWGREAEHGDKLRKYAAVVLDRWPAGKGLLDLHPTDAYTDDARGMAYLMHRNKFLQVASPILRGFELAAGWLDKVGLRDVAAELRARQAPLAVEVQTARDAKETEGTRGRVMYDKCFWVAETK